MRKNKFWGPPSNCKELIKGCRAFLDTDRDVAYRSAIKLAKSRNIDKKLDGALLFLTSWNATYYRFHPIWPLDLYKKLKIFLRKNTKHLQALHARQLEELDSNDFVKVEALFRGCLRERYIGCTGGAKLLHLLEPQLFVMWDTDIRNNYHNRFHKDNRQKSGHKCGDDKCYAEFLQNMQHCAKRLLDEKPKRQLRKACSNKFVTVTIPKALDQFNFAKAKNLL